MIHKISRQFQLTYMEIMWPPFNWQLVANFHLYCSETNMDKYNNNPLTEMELQSRPTSDNEDDDYHSEHNEIVNDEDEWPQVDQQVEMVDDDEPQVFELNGPKQTDTQQMLLQPEARRNDQSQITVMSSQDGTYHILQAPGNVATRDLPTHHAKYPIPVCSTCQYIQAT